MNDIQYVNEHLWIHYVGHGLILLAFFSAIYSFISGIKSIQSKDQLAVSDWSKAMKIGYLIHILSIFSAIFYTPIISIKQLDISPTHRGFTKSIFNQPPVPREITAPEVPPAVWETLGTMSPTLRR